MTQENEMPADPYMRIVTIFDQDPTAGSFLSEGGEGGFAGAVHRMAREIDALRDLLTLYSGGRWSMTTKTAIASPSAVKDFIESAARRSDSRLLEQLESRAADQRAYFDRKQMELPGLEDYMDEDGYLTLPDDIGPLLDERVAHGRFCEADWWLATIQGLREDLKDPSAGEVATLRALLKPFAGSKVSITNGRPTIVSGAGPRDFLNAKAYFGETILPEEGPQTTRNINLLRSALEPFAEAMIAYGDPEELPDDHSVLHAIRDGHLTITGVSMGDLRKAQTVHKNSEREG